jgi:hypothetical protein
LEAYGESENGHRTNQTLFMCQLEIILPSLCKFLINSHPDITHHMILEWIKTNELHNHTPHKKFEAYGGGFGSPCFPYLPVVACLFWAVCLPPLCSLSLVSFSLPCLGAFFL